MSMLNFYINRAGKNLKPERRKILEQAKENLRKQIDPALVEKWLTGAQGWWEVDSLCQMPFSGQEILNNWIEWQKLLHRLVTDSDIHKRRAALVLLTKPVRESDDPRLVK